MPWSDDEQRKQYHRDYYAKNKDKWVAKRAEKPVDKDQLRKAAFDYRLRTVYGMSKSDYDELHAKQGGLCAICGSATVKGKAKQLHVDHCHTENRVRGLLCMRCNTALGWYEKNIIGVSKYLRDD